MYNNTYERPQNPDRKMRALSADEIRRTRSKRRSASATSASTAFRAFSEAIGVLSVVRRAS